MKFSFRNLRFLCVESCVDKNGLNSGYNIANPKQKVSLYKHFTVQLLNTLYALLNIAYLFIYLFRNKMISITYKTIARTIACYEDTSHQI